VGFSATHLRGGSWLNDHINARAVFRNINNPLDRNNNIGFRVVVGGRPTPLSLFTGHPLNGGCRIAPFHQGRRFPELLAEHALPAEAKR
jgi:hypothetical protein